MNKKVEFTEKELAQVWSIVAWFGEKRPVSTTLVRKLYPGDENTHRYKYDTEIEDRIIDIADFLNHHREHEGSHGRVTTAATEGRKPAKTRKNAPDAPKEEA